MFTARWYETSQQLYESDKSIIYRAVRELGRPTSLDLGSADVAIRFRDPLQPTRQHYVLPKATRPCVSSALEATASVREELARTGETLLGKHRGERVLGDGGGSFTAVFAEAAGEGRVTRFVHKLERVFFMQRKRR